MTSLLPVVTKETADSAICDIIREEMQGEPDECLLVDWILKIAGENPAVLMAVNTMAAGSPEREKSAALMGMAITYRTLSAQAEITELHKMTSSPELFAGILAQFERQATANFRAVNPDACEDCGELECVCVAEVEVEDTYDHEAEQERKFGAYIEGEFPGDC